MKIPANKDYIMTIKSTPESYMECNLLQYSTTLRYPPNFIDCKYTTRDGTVLLAEGKIEVVCKFKIASSFRHVLGVMQMKNLPFMLYIKEVETDYLDAFFKVRVDSIEVVEDDARKITFEVIGGK